MKKFKKILMILAICSLSIVAIGCSSEENNTKFSNEEMVKKVTEATKSIKSSKVRVENKAITEVSDQKKEISTNFDIITSSNPSIVKLTGKVRTFGQIGLYDTDNLSGNQDINIYYSEDDIYILDVQDNKWLNVKGPDQKKELNFQKKVDRLDVIIELMNTFKNDLKIEEKDSEYEITFEGESKSVKEALEKAFKANGLADDEEEFNDFKLEKLKLEYKFDKETFIPKEHKIEIILKKSTYSYELISTMEIKSMYSDINKVEPITIPDEVKNAKEWYGGNIKR